ncbi:MAG: hypothetical protein QOE11_3529 [Solirubrobacteraceae bacterium]|jgi:hypothetical protein|nr:hypothetical protein [Solirubrobacteraceae bacterium]
MGSPAIAIATCEWHPELEAETRLLLEALQARGIAAAAVPWSAPGPGGWDSYDAVVVRQTWDYTWRLDEFLAWTASIGERLHNGPEVIAWNCDKRYLFDLAGAGIPAIAGERLPPGAPLRPPSSGRFVVKPAVSGGARHTAVYDESGHDAAAALVARLHADGRDVLVQPYYASVDDEAETAVIFIEGRLSHCMRKGPLLAVGEPPSEEAYGAEDMRRRQGADDVIALAHRTWAFAAERFGAPLYARVDVLRGDDGEPAVLELELIEPALFLDFAPGSAEALAAALHRRAGGDA